MAGGRRTRSNFLYTVAEDVMVMIGPHWFGGPGLSRVTGSGGDGGVHWG